jgi:hypothetical protein
MIFENNTHIMLPMRFKPNMSPLIKSLKEHIGEYKLPIADIYEIKMSGWSVDKNGKVTIYPEGHFDNTEMINVTIYNKKIFNKGQKD